jgi:hypothetical protein
VSDLDLATWITILATWVLAVGTLAFAYWQLRQNQRLHSASTLLDLRERFFSPRLQRSRKAISTWLLKSDRKDEPTDWEVTFFFELLGSLTRTRNLEKRLVRNAFSTWITAYYTGLTQPIDLIAQWRAEDHDPLIFADFEWLARQIIEYERGLVPSPESPGSELEQARYVLEGDSRLEG